MASIAFFAFGSGTPDEIAKAAYRSSHRAFAPAA
jgi:hypothetical protein